MQSPKFKFIQNDLRGVFSSSLLKEEWKKRVLAQIRKQAIFDPIEYRDFSGNISEWSKILSNELIEGSYAVRRSKRFLSEKSRGLCRQMTLVHPYDLLVLERLSRAVYFELKSKAPSKSALFEPDDGNFIKGFKQVDFKYGSYASWKKFQKRVFGFAKENKYIVVTDVANFYDFINFQHLRNIVASLASMRESILDLLIYILNRLTWTPDFMPLTQIGMPQIETTATRVLANAMLYEVDKVCEHATISNYARFMDDMDIGVDSIASAKSIIRDVDLTLQSRQLRLNSSKTKILNQRDAFDHFCITENEFLVRVEKIFQKRPSSRIVKKILINKYEQWLTRTKTGAPGEKSRFRLGNGSKIHKYMFRLIYDSGQSVPDKDLLWLVKNDPGMRSTALRYLSYSSKSNFIADRITEMVTSGSFVDDASMIEISGYLLHSAFKKSTKFVNSIRMLCAIFSKSSDLGLHSSIFLTAKFLGRQELLYLLTQSRYRISGDFWLSRAAGGVSPIFLGTPDWNSYHSFVRDLSDENCYNVVDYMCDVSANTKYSTSLSAYLKARNDTFPQKVYFPKVLVLLAAQKNTSISALFPAMHATHPALKADPFFKMMGFH